MSSFEEMGEHFKELGLGEAWEEWHAMINRAVNDGHYLQDTPEVRARLADADELARDMEDDE